MVILAFRVAAAAVACGDEFGALPSLSLPKLLVLSLLLPNSTLTSLSLQMHDAGLKGLVGFSQSSSHSCLDPKEQVSFDFSARRDRANVFSGGSPCSSCGGTPPCGMDRHGRSHPRETVVPHDLFHYGYGKMGPSDGEAMLWGNRGMKMCRSGVATRLRCCS